MSDIIHKWQLMGQATRDRRLSATDHAVLWALLERMNADRECWPALSTIAADANVVRSGVTKALARLTAAGYLYRFSSTDWVSSNRYRMPSELPALPTEETARPKLRPRPQSQPRPQEQPRPQSGPEVGRDHGREVGRDHGPKSASKNPLHEPVESARKRGARLPEGWTPAAAVNAALAEELPHVDLGRELAMFTDHWRAKAGRDACKADWTAAWRLWVRRSTTYATGKPSPRVPPHSTDFSKTDYSRGSIPLDFIPEALR